MTVRAVGDKFVVSGDYAERGAAPVMAEFRSVPGAGNYWIVVGPRGGKRRAAGGGLADAVLKLVR